jgi:uroporphyrinogen decarboxylase
MVSELGPRDSYGIEGAGQPDFGRVVTALSRHEPDRVPLMELAIDYPVQCEFLGRRVDNLADEIAFWYYAGYDYVYQRPNYEFLGVAANAAVGTSIRRESQLRGAEDAESWDVHGVVKLKTEEDFLRYPWPDPDRIDYSNIQFAAHNLPFGMGLISGVGGIFTRSWMLMGLEEFCMSLCENGGLAVRVIERVSDIQCRVLERVLNMPEVGMIWYGDDLAYTESTIISPDLLRRLILPHIARMAKMTHQSKRLFVMHSDGCLLNIMDDLIGLGVDALHPIEPKAMDIVELKRKFGDRLSLIGNIDLIYTLTRGTPQDVETEVKDRIAALAPGGGYAVGSANSVTRYVPVDNFRAMVNATLRYGKYPIGQSTASREQQSPKQDGRRPTCPRKP